MKKDYLKNIISECCNDVIFEYNDKKSGVTALVSDSIPTFQAWRGDEIREYTDVESAMSDKFYSGKSMLDLVGIVDFSFI